jgi:hypothetical protein
MIMCGKKIPKVEKDRVFFEDINIALEIIQKKELVHVVNEVVKKECLDFKNDTHEVFGIC